MASLEASCFELLRATAGVTALVGDSAGARIYPMRMPEGIPSTGTGFRDSIVYQKISGKREVSHDGDSNLVAARVQFSCWSKTYDGALALAQQVVKTFSGYSGTVAGVFIGAAECEQELDDYDDETKLYRKLVDVVIWHNEDL